MDTMTDSPLSRVLTFGSAVLLGALLTAAVGSIVLGALGITLPHLCAGW